MQNFLKHKNMYLVSFFLAFPKPYEQSLSRHSPLIFIYLRVCIMCIIVLSRYFLFCLLNSYSYGYFPLE